MSNEFPRRNRLYELQPAEKAIWDAMQAVEAMPADPRLTLAINQLKGAASSVADFIDGTPGETPAAPNGPESDKLDQAMNELKSWAGEYCADSDCEYGNDMAMGRHSKFCGMLTGAIADIKDGIRELRGTPTPEAQGAAPTRALSREDLHDALRRTISEWSERDDAIDRILATQSNPAPAPTLKNAIKAILQRVEVARDGIHNSQRWTEPDMIVGGSLLAWIREAEKAALEIASGQSTPAPTLVWTKEKPDIWYKYRWADEPAKEYTIRVGGLAWDNILPFMHKGRIMEFCGPIPSPIETGKGVQS